MARLVALLSRPAWRLSAIALGLAAAALTAALLGPSGRDEFVDWVGGGWVGPLIFVVLYAALTVAFVPGTAGTLAAGALYGIALGSLLVVIAATLGATAAFFVSRRLGRASFTQLPSDRLRRLDERLSVSGLRNLLVVRLLPVVPFNALNYAAGLTGISTRDYVIATAVGIVPGTIAFTAVGASAHDPRGTPFFLSLTALALLVLVSGVLARRQKQR